MSKFIDYNNSFDFKKFIFYVLGFYKWFILSLIVFFIAAFFYNKTQTPIYSNNASIYTNKKNKNLLSTEISFDAAILGSNLGNEDELILLNSFALIKKAIDELQFEVTYFKKENALPFFDNIKNDIELDNDISFEVFYDATFQQPLYLEFGVDIISEEKFRLFALGTEVFLYNYIDNEYMEKIDTLIYNSIHEFNATIETPYFRFTLNKSENFDKNEIGKEYFFIFNNLDYLTLQYRENLNVSQPSPTSNILNISIKGNNFNKITNFLNRLIDLYIENNLDKKNQLALSTIKFIDNQLGEVSSDLSLAESNLEQFRSANQVTDLSFQGQRLFDQLNTLETEKSTYYVQEKYYNYLKQSLEDSLSSTDLVVPSSMGVVDPILTNLVTQLVNLYNQRNNYLESSSSSLYLRDTEIKINNLKKTILESINNNLNTLQISVNEVDYRINNLNKEISKLPKTELQLLGIQREFDLSDAILTFLMQKRSEAQIARASTTPDYEIIEPARRLGGNPVGPKTKLNYVIAMFLGLVLPFGGILIKDFLNVKITDKNDIKDIRNMSFLGNIFSNTRKNELVMQNYPNSSIAESIRAIHTNFQFFSKGKRQIVITVSSSTSGEGKSFFAANLATAFAKNNQRTVILEFDLRRPKINKLFQFENLVGLSSYLINQANIDDIIQRTEVDGLDLIAAGTIAPNPAELVASERTKGLINLLREIYDVIIIDSAPVGLISETFHLMRLSDNVIFVVRQNFSVKEMVDTTLQKIKDNKIENFAIALNDVNIKKESSYRYGGYNSNYYSDDRKGFFQKKVKVFVNNKDKAETVNYTP